MEKLLATGLRIDEKEELKLLPEDVEEGSLALSGKCHQFLKTIESLKKSLDTIEVLLERMARQSERTIIVKLADGISEAARWGS